MNQAISKRAILISIVLIDLLSGMEFDLFVPSFPELHDFFKLTPFLVEWLLSINFVGYCLSLCFVGGLSDNYGRKPVILAGLFTFMLGTILCLIAPSYNALLIGRFLQGVGIAAPATLSFLVIADMYPLKEQQFLMAILNGAINIGVGIAPVIGSYLTLYFHWQGNFSFLLFLGVLALVMVVFFIPSSQPKYGDENVSIDGLDAYLSILRSKPLMLLLVNLLLVFIPYWVFVGMSPLLYIKSLGVSLLHFGYYQGALAFIFAIVSVLYGLLLKNIDYDQRQMVRISIYIIAVSLVMIALVTYFNSTSPLLITLSILAFVMGQIIPSTILYPIYLNFLPHAKGRVSAMMLGIRLILTAVFLQVAGYYYDGSFRNIGIIICVIVAMAIMTSVMVLRSDKIMDFSR